MIQAMVDAFKQPDIRSKLLFTLVILVIFRFIAHIAMPGIDKSAMEGLFEANPNMGLIDLISGGSLSKMSIVALGVYPYITATIIMQVLSPVIPKLQQLQKEGEAGRAKINQYTHWLTIPLAMLNAFGQLKILEAYDPPAVTFDVVLAGEGSLPTISMILAMTAGTMLLVWLGERITERGIGNGISMIIFAGIVTNVYPTFQRFTAARDWSGMYWFIGFAIVILLGVVIFTEAQRRVPVQYSKSVFRGGRMYKQGGASHIPLRVNSAGMIPIIFAMSFLLLPTTIAGFFVGNGVAEWVKLYLGTTMPYYWIAFFLLVVALSFFYTYVTFQQQNLAESLQKQGGFIPGIRPGKPTSKYLTGVIFRITWGGALFLGLIAVMPYLAHLISNNPTMLSTISATSMLILVGVTLDTMRQLESQLVMRRYDGFIK
ncbi:MAG: preprotein translocase subunit SecY [Chloroflexi bacterium]|nr:preprotein translocase subunit SecY [Chloroflexota bacterium]MBT7080864.1 preprotein translocase subunit SecY [Chloroflexota bacterium]